MNSAFDVVVMSYETPQIQCYRTNKELLNKELTLGCLEVAIKLQYYYFFY